MKQIITIKIFLLTTLFSYGQFSGYNKELDEFGKQKVEFLNSAFENNLTQDKEDFFTEWYLKSKKLEQIQSNINNDTIQTLQFIMSDIYYPNTDTVKRYSDRAYYDKNEKKVYKFKFYYAGFFMHAEHFILQPSVIVCIYPDSIFHKLERHRYPKPLHKSKIKCYYPELTFFDKKKLYLDKQYYAILNNFIVPERPKTGKEKYQMEVRRKFLSPQIEMSKWHDGWGYHFETFPMLTRVNFNNSLDRVMVEFRSSFNTGGFAEYRKVSGIWRREKYRRETWIQ